MRAEATKKLAIISLLLAFMQAVFLFAKRAVFSFSAETLFSRSMLTMVLMLCALLLLLVFARRRKYSLSAFPKRLSAPYIIACAAAAVFYSVGLFYSGLTPKAALMLLYGGIVTPLFEELLFRGFIWNIFETVFSKRWMTLVAVTVLFALWHIGYAVGLYMWNGGSLPLIIINKVAVGFLFGAVTGALRYKTGNCLASILVHGVLNSLG